MEIADSKGDSARPQIFLLNHKCISQDMSIQIAYQRYRQMRNTFALYAINKRNPCTFDFQIAHAKLSSPDSNKGSSSVPTNADSSAIANELHIDSLYFTPFFGGSRCALVVFD